MRVSDKEQDPEQSISPSFPKAEPKAGVSGFVWTSAD